MHSPSLRPLAAPRWRSVQWNPADVAFPVRLLTLSSWFTHVVATTFGVSADPSMDVWATSPRGHYAQSCCECKRVKSSGRIHCLGDFLGPILRRLVTCAHQLSGRPSGRGAGATVTAAPQTGSRAAPLRRHRAGFCPSQILFFFLSLIQKKNFFGNLGGAPSSAAPSVGRKLMVGLPFGTHTGTENLDLDPQAKCALGSRLPEAI